MNRIVYALLKGYLRRSVWLYAFFGLAQFLLTGVFWLRGFERMPIAGMALALWGAAAALNANSLVWRSLPITPQDASVYRWWAMAGAPGIYLTLLTGVTWASQRSSGFLTPPPDVILEGIFAIWAVLGVAALLSRSPAFYAARSSSAKPIAKAIFAAILLCYGVPVGPTVRPYSLVFIAVGMILLIISAAQAFRGKNWRWPDMASRNSAPSKSSDAALTTYRCGVWTVLLPLLRRTATVAVIATTLVVLMHFVFPRVGVVLFWIYFIGISTAGFLLTFQFRSALQPLRCLPLSTKQLAGMLLSFGALPGIAALSLTLLVNRAFLAVDLDYSAFAALAIIIIASQALPLRAENEYARNQGVFFRRWFPLLQRIFLPVYIGLMSANLSGAFAALWWFRWVLIAAGVGLCFSGYSILVFQLRAGIRPSSNEAVFSAR